MSYQGVDYTFRNSINILMNNNKPKDNKINQNDTDKERIRRKNNLKIQQHISDLENTVLINQECINNMIPLLHLKKAQKKKLISSLKNIMNYFNEKKK